MAKAGAILDEGFLASFFHCLVKKWKDCEELKPKPKEKWIFGRQGEWRK